MKKNAAACFLCAFLLHCCEAVRRAAWSGSWWGLLVLSKPLVKALEITAEDQHRGFSEQCRVAIH